MTTRRRLLQPKYPGFRPAQGCHLFGRYSSQNSTNNGKEDLPMTPEETKWRASVYAPEKNKAEAGSCNTGCSAPGASCEHGSVVLCTRGHIRLDDAVVLRRLCQHTARHRQPQAAPGREKAVLEWVGTTNANGRKNAKKKYGNHKNEAMSSILYASLPARSLRIRSPKTKTITHSSTSTR